MWNDTLALQAYIFRGFDRQRRSEFQSTFRTAGAHLTCLYIRYNLPET